MKYHIQVVQTWVLDEYDYHVFKGNKLLKTFEREQDAIDYIRTLQRTKK